MEYALDNIRVLDLSRVLAGPYCTMTLADLGAEVIKVEMPVNGDDSRAFGPYIGDESAYFMCLNRNKKSIVLNLKKEEGKEALKRLVPHMDVVIENFRPGTMEKLGIGYDVLREINPMLIFASTSGFGQNGPYTNRPAYDGVVQAMGGIMSITGQKGGGPTRVGPSVGDITSGIFTAIGILAALNRRTVDGIGSKIDVSMLDCQVAILENAVARYFATGTSPEPEGNRHASIVPFEPFETSDGSLMIAAGNDAIWSKFCALLGKEEWIHDERFQTNPLRNRHHAELKVMIQEIIQLKTTDEWQNIFINGGIPCGPINTIEQVVMDPQVQARNMIQTVEHPVAGAVHMPGIPIKISGCNDQIRTPSPVLGEHTVQVLTHLGGYSTEELNKLRERKVVDY